MRRMAMLLVLPVLWGCTERQAMAKEAIPGSQDLATLLATQGYSRVPMIRLATGHYSVEGMAGSVPFDLIIDTGASHTLIDQQRAQRFEMQTEAGGSRATGVGGTLDQRVRSGKLDDVSLGTLRMSSLPVRVLDLSHINGVLSNMGGKPVDGIIGADVLSAQKAVIDYGSGSVFFKE
jgi:predicted aspartyl protease